MNKIQRLLESYKSHIHIPWRDDVAAAQRVIFCVYSEQEELALRAKIDEFDLATVMAGHTWIQFDLTDTFAQWMATNRYAESYFAKPNLINTVLPKYHDHIKAEFAAFLAEKQANENTVVAITGVGSLFGLVKVKDVVDKLAPQVTGRLLVFFPGSYEDKNYRLLDGYDGWNYLAIPITADKEI